MQRVLGPVLCHSYVSDHTILRRTGPMLVAVQRPPGPQEFSYRPRSTDKPTKKPGGGGGVNPLPPDPPLRSEE